MTHKRWRPGFVTSCILLVSLLACLDVTAADSTTHQASPKEAVLHAELQGRASLPVSASIVSLAVEIQFSPWQQVLAVAFSPDGSLLAAAAGQRVHIYQYPSLEVLQILEVGSSSNDMAFTSGKGSTPLLALAAKDGTLQIWKAKEGKRICSISAHPTGVTALTVSPNRLELATTGNDAFVRIWDIRQVVNHELCPVNPSQSLVGGARAIPDAAYSPHEDLIASIDPGYVRLRSPLTTRLAQTVYTEKKIFCLAFHPSGSFLATGDEENRVRIWETNTGNLMGEMSAGDIQSPSRSFIWRVEFDPRGTSLAAATSDARILIWTIDSQDFGKSFDKLPVEVFYHSMAIAGVAFSPDSGVLATGSLDGILRLWNLTADGQ